MNGKPEEFIYAPYIPITIMLMGGQFDHPYRKEYYSARQVCPKCQSLCISQTLMGYTLDLNDLSSYKDENHACCNDCGWIGIVDDLVTR